MSPYTTTLKNDFKGQEFDLDTCNDNGQSRHRFLVLRRRKTNCGSLEDALSEYSEYIANNHFCSKYHVKLFLHILSLFFAVQLRFFDIFFVAGFILYVKKAYDKSLLQSAVTVLKNAFEAIKMKNG